MRLLLDYARAQGFTQTHGPILAVNTHMVELAHDLELKMRQARGLGQSADLGLSGIMPSGRRIAILEGQF
jgi:hypothetical protein